MDVLREEKVRKFVEKYKETGDLFEAGRCVSTSTNKYTIMQGARKMLENADVQAALAPEHLDVRLDRQGIAEALTAIIRDESSTSSNKIQASRELEKVLRYGKDDVDDFQARFERFLGEYGDIFEEFVDGNPKKFLETFQPKLSKGKLTFDVKKNISPRERMKILLRTLMSRNAFS